MQPVWMYVCVRACVRDRERRCREGRWRNDGEGDDREGEREKATLANLVLIDRGLFRVTLLSSANAVHNKGNEAHGERYEKRQEKSPLFRSFLELEVRTSEKIR